MIIDALMNLIEAQNKDMQTHRFFISGQDMAELVRDSLHLKQGNSWILRLVKDIIAKGDYPPLKKHDTNRARMALCGMSPKTETEKSSNCLGAPNSHKLKR